MRQRLAALCTPLLAVLAFLGLLSCGAGGDAPGGSRTSPPPSLAALTVSPATPWKNGVVEFSTECTGSGALEYIWDLGDGTTRTTTEPRTAHVYFSGGERQVSVSCRDATQQRASIVASVTVDDVDLNTVANRQCSSVQPGHGWCVQNPLPTGNGLTSVASVDRATLWIAGDSGSIFKSTDAGHSWTAQASGTASGLNSIAARDSARAWAVGSSGTVIATQDGGSTWHALAFPTKGSLRQVAAPANQTVWVAGDDGIFKTTDGGASWQQQDGHRLSSMAVVSEQVAWAIGPDTMLRTEDGGAHWAPGGMAPIYPWAAVGAASVDVAWAVADSGLMYRTLDGGKSWSDPSAGALLGAYPSSIVALDDKVVWVTRADGSVLSTRDGGTRWVKYFTRLPGGLSSVAAESADRAWAVGPGTILQTIDGGGNWTSLSSGTTRTLYAIAAADAGTAWVVDSAGGILKTENGGVGWVQQMVSEPSDVHALAAVDRQTAWAAGRSGSLWKTTDGGTSWTAQSASAPNGIDALSASGKLVAWAVGAAGAVLHTSDGGATWQRRDAPANENLNDVAAIDAATAWAVSSTVPAHDAGQPFSSNTSNIFKTIDGGLHWTRQLSVTGRYIGKIVAVDASVAWALADLSTSSNGGYTVYRTTDGGATWSLVWTDPTASIVMIAIRATDASRAMVVGTGGRIFETKDGGATWSAQAAGYTTTALSDLAIVDANTAWAVGDQGLILKTLTGGR